MGVTTSKRNVIVTVGQGRMGVRRIGIPGNIEKQLEGMEKAPPLP